MKKSRHRLACRELPENSMGSLTVAWVSMLVEREMMGSGLQVCQMARSFWSEESLLASVAEVSLGRACVCECVCV